MAQEDEGKIKHNLKPHTAKDVVDERNQVIKKLNKMCGTKIALWKPRPDEKHRRNS